MAQSGLSTLPSAGSVIGGKAAVFKNKSNRPVLTQLGSMVSFVQGLHCGPFRPSVWPASSSMRPNWRLRLGLFFVHKWPFPNQFFAHRFLNC